MSSNLIFSSVTMYSREVPTLHQIRYVFMLHVIVPRCQIQFFTLGDIPYHRQKIVETVKILHFFRFRQFYP